MSFGTGVPAKQNSLNPTYGASCEGIKLSGRGNLNSTKNRLSLSGEPVVNLIRSWLPGALLMTIGLQTLAAFVVIHLKAAFFLEVTHV